MTAPGSKLIRRRKIPQRPVTTGWLIILAGLLLAGDYLAPAQSYTVTDLAFPPTGVASEAHAVNRNGFVVGTWWPNSASQYVFFYSNGTNTDLGSLSSAGGYDYAVGNALNGSNQIVGVTTSGKKYDYHAFLYTNGTMVDLGALGDGSWSSANAISQSGVIAGETVIDSGGTVRPALFTNGSITNLGGLPNAGLYGTALGINDSNVVVGYCTVVAAPGQTNAFGFIYSNGVMTQLGTLGSGNYSIATAINNSGQIVGESTTDSGETNAYLLSSNVMLNLGTLGGGNYSTATAINNGGQVAGYATDSNGVSHAFVYAGSTMLNLDSVLPTNCPFTNLAYAYSINDSGQICGGGLTTNGSYDAFLATPTPLILTCSTNITATATSPAGATVFFTVTATGGCSSPTVTADPPSGGTFPIGTNTVNVSARDLCGHTNTCSFTVTVNPPVAIASPTISTNHEFAVMLQGVSGQSYVILTSTNLVDWTPFLTNTLLSTWTNWSDPDSPTNTRRFYRVLTLP